MTDGTFASRYDDVMRQPWVSAHFGDSGFFNTGWWGGGAHGQAEACEALVERLGDAIDPRARTIVDAGCGLGATTRALRRRFPGARVIGVNLSVGQLAGSGASFCAMDAARLALASSSADAVISVEAAFHFDRREDFFAEAWRVLRPGGILVMSDMLFARRAAIGAWMVPEANDVDPARYETLLRRAGFVHVAIDDATAECWLPFCERARLERVRDSVSHYLLVSGCRGDA